MAREKNQTIVRGWDTKMEHITYSMQDKRLNLPPYEKLEIDGIKVRLVLKDGTVRQLPDLNKNFILKEATKFSLIFKKIA